MAYNTIPISTFSFVVKSNILINMELAFVKIRDMISQEPGHLSGIKFSGNVSKKNMHSRPIQSKGTSSEKINFLHACTIRYKHLDKNPEKPINVKLYNNGTMQITGCKKMQHCVDTISIIYETLRQYKNIIYYTEPTAVFKIHMVMKNIHFRFGFCINRHKLVEFFKKNGNFKYIVSYDDQIMTGLNIKKKIEDEKTDTIMIVEFDQSGTKKVYELEIPVEYSSLKTITYIIFYSGVCRFSGTNDRFMEKSYYEFTKLIMDNRQEFEDIGVKTPESVGHIPVPDTVLKGSRKTPIMKGSSKSPCPRGIWNGSDPHNKHCSVTIPVLDLNRICSPIIQQKDASKFKVIPEETIVNTY